MCHNIKVIAKNSLGELSICKECKTYNLEFNNLFFEFTYREFKNFKKFIDKINVNYWQKKHACQLMKRKIPIPSAQKNLILVFNCQEIELLRQLLQNKKKKPYSIISIVDIDYFHFLN